MGKTSGVLPENIKQNHFDILHYLCGEDPGFLQKGPDGGYNLFLLKFTGCVWFRGKLNASKLKHQIGGG